jgi:hypothetical protein
MNIVTVSIPRHKTAIRRSHLSRPIKCALVKTDPVDAAKLLNLLCRITVASKVWSDGYALRHRQRESGAGRLWRRLTALCSQWLA